MCVRKTSVNILKPLPSCHLESVRTQANMFYKSLVKKCYPNLCCGYLNQAVLISRGLTFDMSTLISMQWTLSPVGSGKSSINKLNDKE